MPVKKYLSPVFLLQLYLPKLYLQKFYLQRSEPVHGFTNVLYSLQYSVLAVVLSVVFCSQLHAATDTGTAAMIDGDGLLMHGLEHRLHGIDAPEADQSCIDSNDRSWMCGAKAARVLDSLVKGQQVTCEWTEKDRYGRALSTCRADGINLNAAMVYTGYAVAYRRYSDRYVMYEDEARENRNGIWSGKFLMPWDHRKRGRKVEVPAPDAGRPIKGNISKKGRQYYHCPSDRSYPNTRISTAKGERWFATSLEAESAGWRRPPGYPVCQL